MKDIKRPRPNPLLALVAKMDPSRGLVADFVEIPGLVKPRCTASSLKLTPATAFQRSFVIRPHEG